MIIKTKILRELDPIQWSKQDHDISLGDITGIGPVDEHPQLTMIFYGSDNVTIKYEYKEFQKLWNTIKDRNNGKNSKTEEEK